MATQSEISAASLAQSSTYNSVSFWLKTAGDNLSPRPSLKGNVTADVAIIGGGYSGLWTAYYLLRDNPGLDVAIVEGEICGYGASGRNGGWCSFRLPIDASVLEARYGAQSTRDALLTMYATVDEVERVCESEGIDADFRRPGILNVARGKQQLPSVRKTYDTYVRLGFGDRNVLLTAEEARARINVSDLEGAMYSPASAALHPGKLVRGLARVVERMGGVIYEQSRVTAFEPGTSPRLVTDEGSVVARKALVVAGEAYLSQLPRYHRALLPTSSMLVMTEPLTPQQWSAIGWQGGECLNSQAYLVDYLVRTPDGRITYGSRGAPYKWGSAMKDPYDPATLDVMKQNLAAWFPALKDVAIADSWGGYLGVPRDWTPRISFDAENKVGELFGYTGRGVATTNLFGRMLAAMITGRSLEGLSLPMIGHQSPKWEPEPFRWLGVRYVQNAFRRMDTAVRRDSAPPLDAPLARRLGQQK